MSIDNICNLWYPASSSVLPSDIPAAASLGILWFFGPITVHFFTFSYRLQ